MLLAVSLPDLIPETDKLLEVGMSVLLTVAGAFLIWQLAIVTVGRIERWVGKAAGQSEGGEQRAHTLGQIFRKSMATC